MAQSGRYWLFVINNDRVFAGQPAFVQPGMQSQSRAAFKFALNDPVAFERPGFGHLFEGKIVATASAEIVVELEDGAKWRYTPRGAGDLDGNVRSSLPGENWLAREEV